MTSRAEEVLNMMNKQLRQQYKGGAPQLIRGSDLPSCSFISSGLLAIDWINGGGGPIGHMEQIEGAKSSGKTTLVLQRIAAAQRQGLLCAYFDLEHTLDRDWALNLGVDLDELVLHVPSPGETGEQTLDIYIEMLKLKEFGVIVLDSITSLASKAQLDGSMTTKTYAGNSALLTQLFTKIIGTGILYESQGVSIFINQPREVIGARIPMEKLPGGRALAHYSSIITKTRRRDYVVEVKGVNEQKIGIEIMAINTKNKVGIPYRTMPLRLQFDAGFNPLYDLLLFTKLSGVVEYKGAWAYYKGENLGQGEGNQIQWLMNHPDVYFEIRDTIQQLITEGTF